MGIYAIKPWFQKLLRPVENLFVRFKVHPTFINLLALILSILGGVALYFSERYLILLIYVAIMGFVRTALNALDGLVARRLKVKNQGFGEVLNEFCDRLSDVAIFFGLAIASYTNFVLGSVVVIVILLNSYLSIVSKAARGKRQYGGIMGKADRMIYLSIVCVIVFFTKRFEYMDYFLWFVLIGTLITSFQRFLKIKRELYR